MKKRWFLAIVFICCIILIVSSGFSENKKRIDENCNILTYSKNAAGLKAIMQLERNGDTAVVPCIVTALKNNDFSYRFAAIHALATIGGKEALDYLLARWNQMEGAESKQVSIQARMSIASEKAFICAALFKLGKDLNSKYLYEAVKSQQKVLRYNGAMALGMVDTEKSKELLYNILTNDPAELPKCGAASALLELKDQNVIEKLNNLIATGKGVQCFSDLLTDYNSKNP